MDLLDLPTFSPGTVVRCVVECPAGAAIKFRYEPEHGVFMMGRALPKGLTYPFDFGFIPSTLGADGDPLDVMVIHDAATMPGIVVAARLIGVLEVEQHEGPRSRTKAERNDRFFAVPAAAARDRTVRDVADLSEKLREELRLFFASSVEDTEKTLTFLGWRGPKRALDLVRAGTKAYDKKRQKNAK
jgi:inorganic pyrophosphatase